MKLTILEESEAFVTVSTDEISFRFKPLSDKQLIDELLGTKGENTSVNVERRLNLLSENFVSSSDPRIAKPQDLQKIPFSQRTQLATLYLGATMGKQLALPESSNDATQSS